MPSGAASLCSIVISMRCVPAACLQPEGLKEMYGLINFYKENAKILKDTFTEMGFSVYGEQLDGACGPCHNGNNETGCSVIWKGMPVMPHLATWNIMQQAVQLAQP